MSRSVPFDKYEGLGNDFIVVRAESERGFTAGEPRTLCDRHYGIGADGVLLVLPPSSPGHRARMRVWNADGSNPEMCGNGLRCVVRFLAREDGVEGGEYRAVVETDAGPLSCIQHENGEVEATIGKAKVAPSFDLERDGTAFSVTPVDVGNPHAVIFARDGELLARTVGPKVEWAPQFPEGANVEFVEVMSPTALHVHVWERGVGITRACGTGACAAAAAAIARGLVSNVLPLSVRLPGGELQIAVGDDGVRLRGPARHVFSGRVIVDS